MEQIFLLLLANDGDEHDLNNSGVPGVDRADVGNVQNFIMSNGKPCDQTKSKK